MVEINLCRSGALGIRSTRGEHHEEVPVGVVELLAPIYSRRTTGEDAENESAASTLLREVRLGDSAGVH